MATAVDRLASSKPSCIVALLTALVVWLPVAAAPSVTSVLISSETDESGTLVDIPDTALREAVERELGKAAGDPITRGEMATLWGVNAYGVEQLKGIEYAADLRWFASFGGELSDLTPLASLTSLQHLSLDQNEIVDVGPLADLTSLTYLDLSWNYELVDLEPLAGLTSLTTLELTGADIVDLEPLAALTSLTNLFLQHNSISDASPLVANDGLGCGDLVHLGENPLDANSRGVHIPALVRRGVDVISEDGVILVTPEDAWQRRFFDIPDAALSEAVLRALNDTLAENCSICPPVEQITRRGLATLRRLTAEGVRQLTGIEHACALRELDLSGGSIVDLRPLAGLTSLTSLDLSDNRVLDVSPLTGLTSLTTLDLRLNLLSLEARATHIPELGERGVEVLVTPVSEVPVEKFYPDELDMPDTGLRVRVAAAIEYQRHYNTRHPKHPMIGFDDLLALNAPDSGIEDLTGLDGATILRTLYLCRNNVTDLAPLTGLPDLQRLTLSYNKVEDPTPLAGMFNLEVIALDGNGLHEPPRLSPWLRELYLAGNFITDIEFLSCERGCALQVLDVSANSIASLAPLALLDNLQHLYVQDNEVMDISPLNFESLQELHMRNNAVRNILPLVEGEELLMVDVRRNPLADNALGVIENLRKRGVTVLAGETVPYFPAAGDGRQGFVRVINRGDEGGHAFIDAVDDAGVRVAPVRFELGARRTVHFNSEDLENGNREKGIDGIGAPTAGDWRLSIISARDVEVLSYIRTGDGFVTAMHDVVADAVAPFFNPGSNRNQRSILRVVNTEADPAKWTTGGYDDGGQWRPMTGSMLVRPQHALRLTAEALENAHGMGDGHGKWRLRVRGFPWFAMSLLESPTGHLTNLSTAPNNATPLDVEDGGYRHRLPLVPSGGGDREGFVRVINRSRSKGEVAIEAVDDEGNRFGPVELALDARQTVHFNSNDLEAGNAGKGLFGRVGEGRGDWRLELTSTLDLQVLAYIRTSDGFLTSMHDLAPRTEDGDLWIPFFNPGANRNQVSHLRLVNWGDAPARATITAIDDDGQTPGDAVRVTIPSLAARTFTAAELETGDADGLSGALGDGEGKWRLRVAADEPVDAMSLLSLPTGHMTNLSTTPRHPPRARSEH